MQIKTAVRYHFMPVRMAIIKKIINNKCQWGCREKRTLVHCCCECKLVQPLWKTVWRFLRKLKIVLLYDSAIPALGIYPKKMKMLIQKDTCSPMFIAAITTGSIWKQPNCPSTDEWIKKWNMYTSGLLLSHKNNEILPFATTWMDLEGVILI